MPLFEAQDAGREDFLTPEPPAVGTVGYRRAILNICATWTSPEYEAAMKPVFQWRGWRACVEVMCEMIGAASINCPSRVIDAFGNVKLDSLVRVMDDEEILRHAHATAPTAHPGLPQHEALPLAIADGENLRAMTLDLLPVWNQAATLLRKAESMHDVDPARVLFTRWLNTYDDRLRTACVAAATTHAYWRYRALPPGDEWVETMLNDGPDLSGSVVWSRSATLKDVHRQQPDLVDNWVKRAAERSKPKSKGKKKRHCCPNCGERTH